MRRPFIGGNWKMNTDHASARSLAHAVAAGTTAECAADVVIFPPFPYLLPAAEALVGSSVALGAQDVSSEVNGARTGEISAEMLRDVGASWVIVGHSERRHKLGESEALIADKISMALGSGLRAVLCVGETHQEREAGKAHDIIAAQLCSALAAIDAAAMDDVVIAYEPVWAIGTGITAQPADVGEAHHKIRSALAARYDARLASNVRVVYGGSLVPATAKSIFAVDGVDGGLVGGASLKAHDFLALCTAAMVGVAAS
ncbi:MAG: triose-phosphate isomerase [Planctomycetes bacterium]|nr:triose-phosphate isomerase [Planctomycetota bacterium]